MELAAKLDRLRGLLADLPSALVAFSGGVDSSFLLRVAHDVLGERCLALTTVSPTMPAEDLAAAKELAARLGVAHLLIDANELAIPGYAENPANRCYFCKDHLFTICVTAASPCLSSRFPYGTRITLERLERVEAAERFLHARGFRELRVRFHDQVARLEVPVAEMPRLLDPTMREAVVQELKRLGFTYVALDLQGFRSGSLNEPLRS